VTWITLQVTNTRWEAELMQQMLVSHQIPARVLDQGIATYLGAGSPAALQVQRQDEWTARLLISPIEEEVDS
jgi:hypothetical protein